MPTLPAGIIEEFSHNLSWDLKSLRVARVYDK